MKLRHLTGSSLLLGCSLPLLAQDTTEPKFPRDRVLRDGSWTIYVDNDIANGTDQYYTNGFRFAWLTQDLRTEELPQPYRWVTNNLPLGFSERGTVKNIGLSFGQSLFTPADTEPFVDQPDDRPYAGWLYLGTSIQAKTKNRLDLLELNVGVIGPSALGEQSQDIVHGLIGSEFANGWDNQLEDDFAFNLYYQRKWRQKWALCRDPKRWAFSTHQSVGLSWGNVHIDANAGAAIRFGYNLPDDFGSNRISPTAYVQPATSIRDTEDRGFGMYIFAGVDGIARAHNAFLDGGPWGNQASVDSHPLIGEFEAGIAMTYNEWRVTYTQVFRSDEFENQQDGGQTFGTLAISYRF